MKLVTLVFVASLVLGCRSQVTGEAYDPAVLEEILEGMRKREASIKDVQCEFSSPPLETDESQALLECSWAYKQGKEYWDLSRKYEKRDKVTHVIDSFDGEKRYHYNPDRDPPGGVITSHDKDLFSGSFTPRTLLLWNLDRSVYGFQDVAGYLASSDISDVEERRIGSDRIYVIKGEYKKDPVYEMWVNATKYYSIEKFIQYRSPDRETLYMKVDDIKLEKHNGVWFPVEGTFQYGFMSGKPGKPSISRRLVIKRDSLKINEGIPDEFFRFKFPQGTRVHDAFAVREKRSRFLGKPAPPLHIAHWFGSEPLTLEQLRGKVVWLEFWSMDCGACRGEHYWSLLARLDKELGPKGLVIIAVHKAGVPKANVQELLKGKDICYVAALDEDMEEGPGRTFTAFNAEGWPESHVIDKKGVRRGIGVPLTSDISELEPLAIRLTEDDSQIFR